MNGSIPPEDPSGARAAEAAAILERSSLGDAGFVAASTDVDDEAVAQVLARLARRREQHAQADLRERPTRHRSRRGAGQARPTTTSGAAADWDREVRRLLESAPEGLDIVGELRHRGLNPPRDGLGTWSISAGARAARALIEALRGNWTDGQYRHLYRAARLDDGHHETTSTAPPRVSGVLGTVSTDPRLAADDAAAPSVVPEQLGRRELVALLVERVTGPDPGTTVLFGRSGFGKSTVARAVGERVGAHDVAVFWVAAPHLPALVSGLARVGSALGIPSHALSEVPDPDPAVHADRLWDLLDRSARRWLVVLDDAGADAVGHPGWIRSPAPGRAVLVTSRCGPAEAWAPAVVEGIGPLDPEDGGRVLLGRVGPAVLALAGSIETHARRISALLSGMPLALVGVGDLITGSGQSLETWAERLEPSAPQGAMRTVYDVGLEVLGPHAEQGRLLLRLLSCFAPDEPIAARVLDSITERNWIDPDGTPRDGLAELVRVGLVLAEPSSSDPPLLRLHMATAEIVQADPRIDPATVLSLDRRAVALLAAERRRLDAGRPADWDAALRLEPHVAELVESPALRDAGTAPVVRAEVLDLADRTVQALVRAGHLDLGTTLLDRALVCHAGLGPVHPTMLAARLTRAWAMALARDGDLSEAELRLAELRVAAHGELGPHHPTTLAVTDCLAWTRAEQDDLDGAERLFTEVLDARRRTLPEDHRDTLATRHRLAWVVTMQGSLPKVRQAAEDFADVLVRRRAALGDDHLDVFSTTYRLHWAASRLGRYDEAARGFDDLLVQVERVLGADHPLSLMVRSRCAWTRMWAGHAEEAVRLYEALLPEQEKVLGLEHPRLLINAHNLAALRLQLGDVTTAEHDQRLVVARRADVLGLEHPYTLDSRELHAWSLLRSGRAAEADRELLAVLSDRRRTLGAFHESTLTTRHRILRVVMHRGRLHDAEERARRLLHDLRDPSVPVTPAHPSVPGSVPPGAADQQASLRSLDRRTRHSLALARALQGRVTEADRPLHQVLAECRIELGPTHRDTLVVHDHLAWLVFLSGRVEEGMGIEARVLAVREQVLGPDHPHTLLSLYRRGWMLATAGHHDAGLAEYDRLLPRLSERLGDHDLHTLRTRTARVQALRLAGRGGEAYQEASPLVEDQLLVQGADAVDTLRAREELGLAAEVSGRRSEARAHLVAVRDRRLRLLGADHIDTRRIVRLVDDLAP